MPPAINVENLSKMYRVDAQENRGLTLREIIANTLRSPFRRLRELGGDERQCNGVFWALDDVSFQIPESQIVGIIGHNGAGKSTLLKVLSRITEPTRGRVRVRGRIASLLEVGTGFQPELTGRENVYLNGSILGMSRTEINKKFDEIVQFSGIEKFLDTPVKRYSSGMYVRLAFAVAAHLEPDILVVDEVLAVGDNAFQKKCLGKIQDVNKGGRTVLFVSHNMGAIKQMCGRALVLSKGKLIVDDTVDRAIDAYVAGSMNGNAGFRTWEDEGTFRKIRPLKLGLKNSADEFISTFAFDQEATVELLAEVREPCTFQVTFRVINGNHIPIYTTESGLEPRYYSRGVYGFQCKLPAPLLAPGAYHLFLSIHNPMRERYFTDGHALTWVIEETGSNMARYGRYAETGVILVNTGWTTTKIE